MNVQFIADPAGRLVWASAALPGSAHDLTAARTHGIIAALSSATVMTFADKASRRSAANADDSAAGHRRSTPTAATTTTITELWSANSASCPSSPATAPGTAPGLRRLRWVVEQALLLHRFRPAARPVGDLR
jgi:hypothetical protein